MKRILAMVVACCLLFAIVPCVLAEDDSMLRGGSFESPTDAEYWGGGVLDASAAFAGSGGLWVQNPYGEVSDDFLTAHVLEYNETIPLVGGTMYRLTAQVLNPLASESGAPVASANLAMGSNTVTIHLENIGNEWGEVTDTFLAPKDGEYSLALVLQNGLLDFGMMIDEIALIPLDSTPQELFIRGETRILIPESGAITQFYFPTFHDQDGNPIDLLVPLTSIGSTDLPSGVTFDETRNTLTVTSEAEEGAQIVLYATPPAPFDLPPAEITILLTHNMLPALDEAHAFEGWDFSSYPEPDSFDGAPVLRFSPSGRNAYGSFLTLAPTKSIVLFAGVQYVIRARARLADAYAPTGIYAHNSAISSDATIAVNMVDIGGEDWVDLVAGFTPPADGVYEISVNLCSYYDSPVLLESLSMMAEPPLASFASIRAPGNIAIPTSEAQYPCSAAILDQSGQVMEQESLSFYLSPESTELWLDREEGVLHVLPTAKPQVYTLHAASDRDPAVDKTFQLTLSNTKIGDGGFEEKIANEWWTAAEPAQLSIELDGDNAVGRVVSDNAYCIVLNNSYMQLERELTYKLTGWFDASSPTVVTAFLLTADGQQVALAQSLLEEEADVVEIFTPDDTAQGRLLLYFETIDGDDLHVSMDNLAIENSVVEAADLRLSGVPYIYETVDASYIYINNLADDATQNASTIRWLIGDTATGEFTEIPDESAASISLTADMYGRFLTFEVTPICGKTGLVGTTVTATPVLVSARSDAGVDQPPKPPINEDEAPPAPPSVITLPSVYDHPFLDLTDHWAEKSIATLYAAGVVQGTDATHFSPELSITRAEFCALLLRTMQLAPLAYRGAFSDISDADWFADSVQTLVDRQLVQGSSPTEFSPNRAISREEIATLMMRAYALLTEEPSTQIGLSFHDKGLISDWAVTAVREAVSLGLLQGTEQNLFEPSRDATRAEAGVILFRFATLFQESHQE